MNECVAVDALATRGSPPQIRDVTTVRKGEKLFAHNVRAKRSAQDTKCVRTDSSIETLEAVDDHGASFFPSV